MKKIKFQLAEKLPAYCRFPCLLVILGIALMITGNVVENTQSSGGTYVTNTESPKTSQSVSIQDGAVHSTVTDWRVIIEYHQNRLTDFLQNVKGVGGVSVLVYCDRSSILELVANSTLDTQSIEEEDGSGGSRVTETSKTEIDYLTVQDSEGNQRVVAISESIPAITSICVVCTGGDKAAVQERVITALSTLYSIPAYKIVVIPGE